MFEIKEINKYNTEIYLSNSYFAGISSHGFSINENLYTIDFKDKLDNDLFIKIFDFSYYASFNSLEESIQKLKEYLLIREKLIAFI